MYNKKTNGEASQQQQYTKSNGYSNTKNSVETFWNDQIMERFIKANLFIICCVAAGLLLIVYLGAFSCEVSWLLEAHGDLPISSYILCAQFFIVFVATTILLHGLVTGLPWGLFAWSAVIGLLSIPELIFVMIMTTQHWGLQSVHGLTELISYLVRLIINCSALICVIPTAIRWRREAQVLTQLQSLATRLQLQTPPPSLPFVKADSRRASKRRQDSAFENGGYEVCEPMTKINMNGMGSQSQGLNTIYNNKNVLFGSQNEFNAAIFMPQYTQQFNGHGYGNGGLQQMRNNGNRAQSLMDLRCTLPGMYNPRYVLDTEDKNAKYFNITIEDLKNSIHDSNMYQSPPSLIGSSINDPIYCSIEPNQRSTTPKQRKQCSSPKKFSQQQQNPQQLAPTKLTRKCISLENLDGIGIVESDLAAYGNHLLHNYTQQQQYYLAMLNRYLSPLHGTHAVYRRPSTGSTVDPPFSQAIRPQPMPRRSIQQQQLQYYGGFDYANFTNPYITANSKLSLGNESDDYRKYRDVAL